MFVLLQWNARSLISNGQEFKKYISDLVDQPHVVCVQETWLHPHLDFVIPGYTAIRKDREHQQGGGVATFVQIGLSFKIEKVGLEDEVVVIRVWADTEQIVVVNFYNPGHRLSVQSLEEVCQLNQGKIIWCGDFNSHNSVWGSCSTDSNGETVEEFISSNSLVCLNDGRGTRFNVRTNTESVLDLTLASSAVAVAATWEVDRDCPMGSDHFPIVTRVGIEIPEAEEAHCARWKFGRANWGMFQSFIRVLGNSLNVDGFTDVEVFNDEVVSAIIQAAEASIPKSAGRGTRKSVPWWNEECSEAIKVRNKAYKQVRRNFTPQCLNEYKRAQAILRRTIRTAKRSCWRQYCNTIGRETKLSDIWGVIRKMSGIRRTTAIPVLKSGSITAVKNQEKAELLVNTFVKIHSSENLSESAKESRDRTLAENPDTLLLRGVTDSSMERPFSLFELKRALTNVKQSTPGRDDVSYLMLAKMEDEMLVVIRQLFNLVWETGKIPNAWKQSVIVPILKPGKEASDPSSYRPIALTSQLGKTMERMVTERLNYFLESNNLLSPFQSGFRKGRNTSDSLLCLESEIRKAHVNKEKVVAVFFDIEKAYDMLWKEGLLIKIAKLGVGGRLYNWVRNFLCDRKIMVKVGTAYSSVVSVENGTPQGSVCSPVLFDIMINDIFEKVEKTIGKSLYADDGALWMKGRNLKYLQRKMQQAIDVVEEWANSWAVKMSVAKTQVICFSKKYKEVSLYLYGQKLEQVRTIRFLGNVFDDKLCWRQHVESVQTKCKKVNNLLRCLAGQEWGASKEALVRVYQALMRSSLDYGSIAYMAAAETHLVKLDRQQNQALRTCCGAFRTSPVSALQVEVGEIPLRLRRLKLMLTYWLTLQGHNDSHPAKAVLRDCWEHQESCSSSFGWVGDVKAEQFGLKHFDYCPTVPRSPVPPWLFIPPDVDISVQEVLKSRSDHSPEWLAVQKYFLRFGDSLILYTDGSKDPDSGRTGAAVNIPSHGIGIKKRLSDHLAVYTTEIVAIALALKWLLVNRDRRVGSVVIASDSQAALMSIKTGSSCRMDQLYKLYYFLLQLSNDRVSVKFIWIPAHVGIEGNEEADILAKQALRLENVSISVPLSRAEGKSLIHAKTLELWQESWDTSDTGRHLYSIQNKVSCKRVPAGNRREEIVLSRLRIGHTGLNHSLWRIGKHQTGSCSHCGIGETVQHVLLECRQYAREREPLMNAVRREKKVFSLSSLLGDGNSVIRKALMNFLRDTVLIARI